MSLPRGAALFLLLAVLFLIANRPAYKGWFYDDDLDNLLWTSHAPAHEFALGVLSPRFSEFNYRPSAHVIYHVLGTTVGLDYPWYVGVIHILHLFNCWLVWLLLRKLGASLRGAAAGTVLFAFHMACFDAYWKPMFMFDVVATMFLLLAFLAWLYDRWLLALIPFWLAYKSKELAVAFPAFLLLYEYMLGQRRWRRVMPFAAIALWFAVQGILRNAGTDNDYTLRFTPQAVWKTLGFYASQVLLVPWLGLALIPAAFLTRDRRVRFGLITIAVLLGPLWFLPGRLFSVYLYLPLIGLSIAFAFASENWKPLAVVALFAVWLPWNYQLLREGRKAALTIGPENRQYVEQVETFYKGHKQLRTILLDGGPAGMNRWGIVAAFNWFYWTPDLKIASVSDEIAQEYLKQPQLAVIGWDRLHHRMIVAERRAGEPEESFISMTEGMRIWQLISGWFPMETGFRWTRPEATAKLRRPAGASEFELAVNLGPMQKQDQGGVTAEVLVDGVSLGERRFTESGTHGHRWPLIPGPAGLSLVELRFSPPYRPANGDPRTLGAAVARMGFVE